MRPHGAAAGSLAGPGRAGRGGGAPPLSRQSAAGRASQDGATLERPHTVRTAFATPALRPPGVSSPGAARRDVPRWRTVGVGVAGRRNRREDFAPGPGVTRSTAGDGGSAENPWPAARVRAEPSRIPAPGGNPRNQQDARRNLEPAVRRPPQGPESPPNLLPQGGWAIVPPFASSPHAPRRSISGVYRPSRAAPLQRAR
jgi:hypothetical protein